MGQHGRRADREGRLTPVFHEGAWWHQQPDGTWLRFNDETKAWEGLPPSPESLAATVLPWVPGKPYALAGIAKAVVVLLAVGIVVDLGSIVSGAFEINLLNRLIDGEAVSDASIDANDARVVIVSIVQFTAYAATVVMFLVWFYRAYSNVDALNPSPLRFGKGWAIGAWFVPILNLWRPKQIANDIWRTGDPEAVVPALLHWWWAAWVLSPLTYGVAGALYEDYDLEGQRTGAVIYMVSDALSIAAAALLIVIVRRATERLEQRRQAFQ